jgi:hypothetical protein
MSTYAPATKLADAKVVVHRQAVTLTEPSLPQCAGRALRHLANPVPLRQPVGSKRITVYPLVQPHPDVARPARAFLASAR